MRNIEREIDEIAEILTMQRRVDELSEKLKDLAQRKWQIVRLMRNDQTVDREQADRSNRQGPAFKERDFEGSRNRKRIVLVAVDGRRLSEKW